LFAIVTFPEGAIAARPASVERSGDAFPVVLCGSTTAGKVEMGNNAGSLKLDQIGPDTLLRLKDAVSIAFPMGGMTVSGLRKERDRGRLVVEKIAGREFTSLRNIEKMREKCRDVQRVHGSGSNQKSTAERENLSGAPHGSFETERKKSALAALEQTARGLSKPSQSTSPKNIQCRVGADVIHLKS
jgi:hypothetical protein